MGLSVDTGLLMTLFQAASRGSSPEEGAEACSHPTPCPASAPSRGIHRMMSITELSFVPGGREYREAQGFLCSSLSPTALRLPKPFQ
jgi:hypothetical protein